MEKVHTSDTPASIPVDMYQIPGHGMIDLNRYVKCMAEDDAIERVVNEEDPIPRIARASVQGWGRLMREVLSRGNMNACAEVAKVMECLSPTSQERDTLRGLLVQRISEALSQKDLNTQRLAASLIFYVSDHEPRSMLLRHVLCRCEIDVQREALYALYGLPEVESELLRILIAENIRDVLSRDDEKNQLVAVSMMRQASSRYQEPLLKQALWSKNINVQQAAAFQILYLPLSKPQQISLQALVAERIGDALYQDDSETQKIAAEMILYTLDQDRVLLMRELLLSSRYRIKVWEQVIWLINATPITTSEKDSLYALVVHKIRAALLQDDVHIQEEAALAIDRLPLREGILLRPLISKRVRDILTSGRDRNLQKRMVQMIQYTPEKDRPSLIKLAFHVGLGNEVIQPPLYAKSSLSPERFGREGFDKTGSEMTLIGGSLKGTLMIRHIKPSAFLAWKRAYERYDVWQKAGFSYVPIEPIQAYRLTKAGTVDVFSGVLDLHLAQWVKMSSNLFGGELFQQKKVIQAVLEQLGIKHGHPHNQNFVLRFYRGVNGDPDITKTPRLYLIDFDQAIIENPKGKMLPEVPVV